MPKKSTPKTVAVPVKIPSMKDAFPVSSKKGTVKRKGCK